eukprot:4306801-Prymnesium_polylepis.3
MAFVAHWSSCSELAPSDLKKQARHRPARDATALERHRALVAHLAAMPREAPQGLLPVSGGQSLKLPPWPLHERSQARALPYPAQPTNPIAHLWTRNREHVGTKTERRGKGLQRSSLPARRRQAIQRWKRRARSCGAACKRMRAE